ncbi:hypothetical protein HanXRQr2_Chr03g0124981 [Helianthus annuus]|uniref:Uncharacterized protein n=1 Tax=Helianthus annuus TaxID=4232 RepID=A0A9K3JI55_HELAN|nr:hypothetical protein HanXRQr2_Chr03g0124981 [Helianthus annuus]
MQHPRTRTRFVCWSLAMGISSFLNSTSPCPDVLESLLIATSCPSLSFPCYCNINLCVFR